MKSLSRCDQEKQLNTFHFESPSHSGYLLNGLCGLHSRNLLLDVTLITDGQHFKAHRVVLASCSDYFRAMFTDALKESQLNEIYLKGVSAEGMRYLLEYVYTSRLAINLANIQDILAAANHVQMFSIVEACSRYLQEQLDLENCVDLLNIAETYSLHQLSNHAYQFMCSCLCHFSQAPDFQRLSASQLEHLLKCDFPVDCNESHVLKIVTGWLEFSLDERLQYARQLLSSIHFEEIPSHKIMEFTKLHIFHTIFSTATFQLQKRLHNINSRHHVEGSPATLVNSRGMELAIVKVGGFGISGITNDITYYLPSQGKWCHLTSIPHVEQCKYGTAVLNNELYVVGGCFNQGGSFVENIHPFGFRFNPRYNRWTTIAPLQQERCRFSLCAIAGELYAVGGTSEGNEDGSEDFTNCEKYDPDADMWLQTAAPLPGRRTQHAGATWGDSLFVSGGLDQDSVISSVYRYDVFEDKWEERANMLLPRADHCMVVYKDRLYVCGGWYEDESTGNRVIVDTIDSYDILTDKWETVSRMPTPRYHASAVLMDDLLYIIGGLHSDVTFDRATGVIECYSFERGTWTTINCYPQDIWEHCCVSLYIPRRRDDMEVATDVT
ncbi:hypothetical protein CHUAL_014220 [Chamberlinius hualienensis]